MSKKVNYSLFRPTRFNIELSGKTGKAMRENLLWLQDLSSTQR